MRQQTPPVGTVFLLCTHCDRAEWRKLPAPSAGQGDFPPCKHCGGVLVRRHPVTLPLTDEDRGLLKFIAENTRTNLDAAATLSIRNHFRKICADRMGKGKNLPQWAAEWLQNNPEK